MKSRLLGIAVVLVALAVIINALALESAEITNKVSIDVVGNAAALIGITAATGVQDPDVTVTDTNKQAVITLPALKGAQAASQYVFDAAFAIKNNSGDTVDISIDPITPAGGVGVTFEVSTLPLANPFAGLAPGEEAWVKMTVTVAEGAGSVSLPTTNFKVHANR
ncbi:MAG TPA: hypothetical protein VD973_06505 [Symbiobacteriaceae bacterium]|jgi:cell division septation protein DedD|nr:hypothetical protein [Symbiobacteriaceae bacterium]